MEIKLKINSVTWIGCWRINGSFLWNYSESDCYNSYLLIVNSATLSEAVTVKNKNLIFPILCVVFDFNNKFILIFLIITIKSLNHFF